MIRHVVAVTLQFTDNPVVLGRRILLSYCAILTYDDMFLHFCILHLLSFIMATLQLCTDVKIRTSRIRQLYSQ